MDIQIGKVVKVFIPDDYNNGRKIDVMDCQKIGFEIDIDGEIIEIIQEQNEYNVQIYKDDIVTIKKQILNGKEYIDIEPLLEEDYE